MEEKDILQPEQKVEQPVIEVVAEVDGEVASFDQQPAPVQPAPQIEVPAADISKDVESVSADEKVSIEQAQEQAQQKAKVEYRGVFGDRQIRKTNKTIGIVIAIAAILLVGFFVVSKIPMFYNCMVPSNADSVKGAIEETNIKDVELGDDVWAIWYDYDERNDRVSVNFLPGVGNETKASSNIFANLDNYAMDDAEEYYQINWMLCQKETNSTVKEDIKYATVIWYQFDDVEDSKEYAELQKEKYAGEYEHKNALFHQLGMVKGSGNGFVYDAWYNGAYYIEIYATDVEYQDGISFAEYIRTQINYNA